MSAEPPGYRPPPIDGPHPEQRRGVQWKAVLYGLAADWAGTFVSSFFISFMATMVAAMRFQSEDQMRTYLEQLFTAPDFLFLTSMVGLLCVALGGYVAGVRAKRDPVRHALMVGFVSLGLSLSMEVVNAGGEPGVYPLWLRWVGNLLVVPFAYLGGRAAAVRPLDEDEEN
ncbi:hypothetical protein MK489_02460 [Myxococcota bacterium]|nr:hypothetical protein [Myxococcota bacterium]